MAFPVLAAAVGVSAATSLAQLYMAEKARGAAKDRLNELSAKFDSIVPPQYNLKITDPPQLITQRLEAPDLPNIPSFNPDRLKLEKYKQLDTYKPELAAFTREQSPELIKDSAEAKYGKDAQMAALRKYTQLAEGGYDPEYMQKVQDAGREAGRESQAQNQYLTSQFHRRGQLGSGLEFAAKQSANMRGLDAMAKANQSAATDSYRNQLAALASGANLGGQLRNQDFNQQQANTNTINNFNQRMSKQQQDYDLYRANQGNQAQLHNQAGAQQTANANTGLGNQAATADQSRSDQILKALYAMKSDQANALHGHNVNERNYANDISTQKANWDRGAIDRENLLKTQQYNDALGKVNGQAGISNQQGALAMQAAQDRIAAMQGLSQAGIGAAQAYHGHQQDEKWDKRYDQAYGVQ